MLHKLRIVDSTQKYIIDNINTLNIGDAVYATQQTHGYGRTGIWKSDEKNIYFSMLTDNINHSWLYVLCAMHIFCSNNIQNNSTLPNNLNISNLYIKIPNDIYYKDKKLGGFIIEKIEDKLIIGVGINIYLNTPSFTSINNICPLTKSVDSLCKEFYNTLNKTFHTDINDLHKYFINNTHIINKKLTFIDLKTGEQLTGQVSNLNYDTITINNITYNMYQIKITKLYIKI